MQSSCSCLSLTIFSSVFSLCIFPSSLPTHAHTSDRLSQKTERCRKTHNNPGPHQLPGMLTGLGNHQFFFGYFFYFIMYGVLFFFFFSLLQSPVLKTGRNFLPFHPPRSSPSPAIFREHLSPAPFSSHFRAEQTCVHGGGQG